MTDIASPSSPAPPAPPAPPVLCPCGVRLVRGYREKGLCASCYRQSIAPPAEERVRAPRVYSARATAAATAYIQALEETRAITSNHMAKLAAARVEIYSLRQELSGERMRRATLEMELAMLRSGEYEAPRPSHASEPEPIFDGMEERHVEPSLTDDCPICLEPLHRYGHVKVTRCQHMFHPVCIYRNLMRSKLCPICRGDLSS